MGKVRGMSHGVSPDREGGRWRAEKWHALWIALQVPWGPPVRGERWKGEGRCFGVVISVMWPGAALCMLDGIVA